MNTPTWPVVCATGPRPHHLPPGAEPWVRAKLHDAAVWLRDQCGTTVGLSGMALGVDTWWAQALLDAGLTLGAYVPHPQQDARWPRAARAEWARLRGLADPGHSRMVSDHHHARAMTDRNRALMEDAVAVVAVMDPARRWGGTFDAVRIAHRLGRTGVWLDPVAQVVRRGLPNGTA